MAEVTYYWDGGSGNWADTPNAFNGNRSTFAYTATDGQTCWGNSTTCDGTDLGTITKVEIQCYGYGDGNDRIDLSFGTENITTPEYQLTMPASEGWSAYADVTADTNVDGWTWAKIADLYTEMGRRCFLEFDKVAGAHTLYCAKVEIRVTYTPSAGYYHGLKVQGIGELALCDVGTHPLRFRKGGTTHGIELVATDDPNASAIRIKTPGGIKAIRKYT